jgi:hypothetical protein
MMKSLLTGSTLIEKVDQIFSLPSDHFIPSNPSRVTGNLPADDSQSNKSKKKKIDRNGSPSERLLYQGLHTMHHRVARAPAIADRDSIQVSSSYFARMPVLLMLNSLF